MGNIIEGAFAILFVVTWVVFLIVSVWSRRLKLFDGERMPRDHEAMELKHRLEALQREYEQRMSALETKINKANGLYEAAIVELRTIERDRDRLKRERLRIMVRALCGTEEPETLPQISADRHSSHAVYAVDSSYRVNSLFLDPAQAMFYCEALADERYLLAQRADMRCDILSIDKAISPYGVTAEVTDRETGKRYILSLDSCECGADVENGEVCVHMLMLALKVGAVSGDVRRLEET